MISAARIKHVFADKLIFHRDTEILGDQVENNGTKNKLLLPAWQSVSCADR